MAQKSDQLQIRVSPGEKAALRKAAAAAGQDVSRYVLARALPPARARFEELLGLFDGVSDHRYPLAELNDLLSALTASELREAVTPAVPDRLSPFIKNYIAAMVELSCHLRGVPAPGWVADVAPLEKPHFAAPLMSLRLHLLRASPVPFKRRNIFIDASLGARV
jgi:hypothetical protein